MVTSGMADKRRHARKKQPKRNTITKRWVFNNLGLIFLVLLAIDFGVIYSLQNYYYNAAQQYLTTKATSISGVLTRYAQDVASYDRATHLEAMGYDIMTMPRRPMPTFLRNCAAPWKTSLTKTKWSSWRSTPRAPLF